MKGNGLKGLNYGATHFVSFLLDALVQRGLFSTYSFALWFKNNLKENPEQILREEQLNG